MQLGMMAKQPSETSPDLTTPRQAVSYVICLIIFYPSSLLRRRLYYKLAEGERHEAPQETVSVAI
jgi:hypothetical protein